MTSLVLFLILLAGIMIGMFVGLTVCDRIDLGDFAFTDIGRDLSKCAVMSVVIAAAGVGLFQLSQSARVFLALVPLFYVGVRLSWLEISMPELALTGFATILSLAGVTAVTFMLLGK
jgi:hypothetical protein